MRRQIIEPFFGLIFSTLKKNFKKHEIEHLLSSVDSNTKYYLMSQYHYLMHDSADFNELLKDSHKFIDKRFLKYSDLDESLNTIDSAKKISNGHLASSIIGKLFSTKL